MELKWTTLSVLMSLLPYDVRAEPTRLPASALQTPNEAVALAWLDVQQQPLESRPFVRYLWIQDGDNVAMKTSSLALNYVSRSDVIYRPWPIAQGHLLRVDLRQYVLDKTDLKDWLRLWEELGFDPMFSLLLTKDTLRFASEGVLAKLPSQTVSRLTTKKIKIPGPKRTERFEWSHKGGKFVWPDDSGRVKELAPGEYWTDLEFNTIEREVIEAVTEPVNLIVGKDVDVVRLDALHIDQGNFARLKAATGSIAPVVDHRYFKTRALSSIKDKGVYAKVFGGLYYEFKGIKLAKEELGKDTKATDFDLFLEKVGVGNIKAGLTYQQLFDKLPSDQRTGLLHSGVTDKPRIVFFLPVLSGKRGNGRGAITYDVKDQDVDLASRGFANLNAPKAAAMEAIFPYLNGLPIVGLFNGDGVLQDEAPFDVVLDTTIPDPHTKRLESMISCIRCHGKADFWQPVDNDVKAMLAGRLEVFGDLSRKGKEFDFATVNRTIGQYFTGFNKHLLRNRDDFAEAVLEATGPWTSSPDQKDVGRLSSARLGDEYRHYNYDKVDAKQALNELGVDCGREEAAQMLNDLLPPDARSASVGFVPEDIRIGALRVNRSLNRSDFALVYGFLAERVQAGLRRVREAQPSRN